jgi:toxin-antitoxin system PIN domain toxin
LIPDVNVLVAAFRGDHTHHAVARKWLLDARAATAIGERSLLLLPVVVAGFLRLVTNKRVFNEPNRMEDAVGFIDALMATPGVEMRVSTDEWPILRSKLLTQPLVGNLVTDAAIASIVQSLGEHLITFDRDFRKLMPSRDLTLLRKPK